MNPSLATSFTPVLRTMTTKMLTKNSPRPSQTTTPFGRMTPRTTPRTTPRIRGRAARRVARRAVPPGGAAAATAGRVARGGRPVVATTSLCFSARPGSPATSCLRCRRMVASLCSRRTPSLRLWRRRRPSSRIWSPWSLTSPPWRTSMPRRKARSPTALSKLVPVTTTGALSLASMLSLGTPAWPPPLRPGPTGSGTTTTAACSTPRTTPTAAQSRPPMVRLLAPSTIVRTTLSLEASATVKIWLGLGIPRRA
mmetsp:Transcript_16512/g.39303  ORF Transcript_16512/g.39303 Transcript_16512/m.39303 type:complete len:253 (-) Transcript_16512:433-1191(-)